MGRYILSVVEFDGRRGGRGRGPNFAASIVERTCTRKRPNSDIRGLRPPSTEDEMCIFTPPRTFPACKAATLGAAPGGTLSNPKKIVTELHVNWGQASDQKNKRVLADSEAGNLYLLRHADADLGHCDVCRAFDPEPQRPSAGTSTVSMSMEKLQVDPLLLHDIVALRVMDVFLSAQL